MSWFKTTSRLLWLVILISILFTPDNVHSRLLSISSGKKSNIQEPLEDGGYLTDVGPAPIRYAKEEIPFNRLDLIPLPDPKPKKPLSVESTPTPPPPLPQVIDYKAGTNNAMNASTISSPNNVTATVEPALSNNSNSLTPDDILLFLEKDRNSDKTGSNDKVVLPFRLPFQNSNEALPPPSKAIYERQ